MKTPFYVTAAMSRDHCLGAAIILSFVSDLFTISGKDSFTRVEVLAILDTIGKRELPEGMMDLIRDTAEELNPPGDAR